MGKCSLVYISIVFFLLLSGCSKNSYLPEETVDFLEKANCSSTSWPHELSEIAADSSVIYGKLASGFRYMLKTNGYPKDRVALYLQVQVGSRNEQEEERGYAHFLEHMLFNGTTHFPPGTLVEYFQDNGMSFGADTNAHTGLDETVYKIILPKGNKEEVEKGLLVFSDFSRGALLLEEEVARERGIILAEKLLRDSAEDRIRVAAIKNSLHGTVLAERQVIGVEETIKKANSLSLRRFYQKWYRPENMTLLVVGDFDASAVEPLIHEYFFDFRSVEKKPDCPPLGRIDSTGLRTYYYYEPDAAKVRLAVKSYWNKEKENDSPTLQKRNIHEYTANLLVEKRLEKIVEQNPGLFMHPSTFNGNLLDRIGFSGVSVTTDRDNWQKSLSLLENTLRQMILYGATVEELDIARKEIISSYDYRQQTAETQSSKSIARGLLWHTNNNRVYQSPEKEKEIYVPAVAAMNVADVNRAFRSLWSHGDRLVEVKGNLLLDEKKADTIIRAIFHSSQQESMVPYAGGVVKELPLYNPEEPPAEPDGHIYFEDIDTHVYRYSNGVMLNLKKTDFKKNKVNVVLEFGHGRLGETMPGLAMLSRSVVNSSGTGTLTQIEINESLAGSSVEFGFSTTVSSFVLKGSALSEESELLMQALYALLRDPGFRNEVFVRTINEYEQKYEVMSKTIRGMESLHANSFLTGGNSLFRRATLEELSKVTLSDIRLWITHHFSNAIPEISVVGDFDREQIIAFANRYFANLKAERNEIPGKVEVVFPAGKTFEKAVPTKIEKALVVMAWKTDGFTSIENTRRLNMLAAVIEDRVRLIVREKLGASYSPDVYQTFQRVVENFGLMKARIQTDPALIKGVVDAVSAVCKDIRENGVTDEELARVKNPLMTYLKEQIEKNGYWLDVLRKSSRYPEQFTWPKTVLSSNRSISAKELTDLARKYLTPENVATVILRPM